mgnify:CR=1 FL=1
MVGPRAADVAEMLQHYGYDMTEMYLVYTPMSTRRPIHHELVRHIGPGETGTIYQRMNGERFEFTSPTPAVA